MVEEIERLENSPREESTPSSFAKYLIPLNESKLKHLFNGLVDNEFIDKQTNINHFYFVFGGLEVPPDTSELKPIKWLKNKQLLRELIFGRKYEGFTDTGLLNTNGVVKATVSKEIPLFFRDKNNRTLRLANDKFEPSCDSDIINNILKSL